MDAGRRRCATGDAGASRDNADRESAYDAESQIGTFSDALIDEAKKKGWAAISMKDEWKKIFAFEKMK